MQVGHVVRLRDVRFRQRSRRPQAHVRGVPLCWRRCSCCSTRRRATLRRCSRSARDAFFATGYFSGFGAVTAELYPTAFARPRRASPTTSAASQRRRAVRGRRPHRHARLSGRAVGRRGRLRARGGVLDRDSGDERQGDQMTRGLLRSRAMLAVIAWRRRAASCSGSIASTTSRDRVRRAAARLVERRRRQRDGHGRDAASGARIASSTSIRPRPATLTGYLFKQGTGIYLDLAPVRGKDFGSFIVPAHGLVRVTHWRRSRAK